MSSQASQWITDFVSSRPLLLTFKTASWRHWQLTLMWVAYNFLGSLMPIWGTYFLLHLYGQSFYLNDFVKHGEFTLLTAAFLAPALQQVVQSIRDDRYVLGTGAVLIAVTGLVVAAIVYSGIVTGNPPFTHDVKGATARLLNEHFLFSASITLFSLSLFFAVAVTLVEKVIFEVPFKKMDAASEKDLSQHFDRANPESAPGLIERGRGEETEDVAVEMELGQQFTAPVEIKDK